MRAFIRFSAIILAALAFSPTTHAAETSRHVVTTENGDYFGFDLRTEQNVTLGQCEKVCIADAACRAFTYNPKVKWCFLKSDYNRLNTFNGAIAGKIVEAASNEPDIGAPPALPFLSEQLLADARAAKDNLALEADQEGQGLNGLIVAAHRELAAGNIAPALKAFQGALAILPDDGALWIEAARAANRVYGNTDFATQAALAAINGYQLTRTTQSRADALAVLAKALESSENFRAALGAYKASLALVETKAVRAAHTELKTRQGFRVTDHTVDSDSAIPRVCAQFSEPLIKTDYTPFVTLDGAAPKALEAKGSEICVEGLSHGQRYKLAFRKGLPSAIADEPLDAQVNLEVFIPDRAAMVRFTGDSFVLPGTARRGIPIVSVNTTSANLKLYRIGDRNIASLLTSSQFLTQLDGYSAERIRDENGEMVWQGSIDISTDLNKEVVTSFPVDEALPQRKPGVYVLTAVSATGATNEWDSQATQWFVVSDIGLSTYSGTDGLSVFARSLASAKQIAGVELTLLAKNNEILGTVTTDADGRATFDAGLLR
ncbi:MAG: PAN domain-containing protein, partial [Rhizobium giardinii]